MCGRFTLYSSPAEIAEFFGLEAAPAFEPSYNIPPSVSVPACLASGNEDKTLKPLTWGLIPHWQSDPEQAKPLINARVETAAEKPSFREAFERRRCLVPTNGFYEWQKTSEGKQPYYIHAPDRALFAFAGIWDRPKRASSDEATFAILTKDAVSGIDHIHSRMPCIVDRGDFPDWLEPGRVGRDLFAKIAYSDVQTLEARAVSTKVNSPRNDSADLVEAVQ